MYSIYNLQMIPYITFPFIQILSDYFFDKYFLFIVISTVLVLWFNLIWGPVINIF